MWSWFVSDAGQTFTQNLVALLALGMAGLGVRTWRKERRDVRRAELAEQCLAAAYRARDVIHAVRNPMSIGEGGSRPKDNSESEKVMRARTTAYIPVERLNAESDAFDQIITLGYTVRAAFGPEAAQPLDQFLLARNRIWVAAQWKWRYADHEGPLSKEEAAIDEKYTAIYYEGLANPDPIAPMIDTAVAALEKTFRPHVEATFRVRSIFSR